MAIGTACVYKPKWDAGIWNAHLFCNSSCHFVKKKICGRCKEQNQELCGHFWRQANDSRVFDSTCLHLCNALPEIRHNQPWLIESQCFIVSWKGPLAVRRKRRRAMLKMEGVERMKKSLWWEMCDECKGGERLSLAGASPVRGWKRSSIKRSQSIHPRRWDSFRSI